MTENLLNSLGIKFLKEEGVKVDTFHYIDSHGQKVFLRQFGNRFTAFCNVGKDCHLASFKEGVIPTYSELMREAFDFERRNNGVWVVC